MSKLVGSKDQNVNKHT